MEPQNEPENPFKPHKTLVVVGALLFFFGIAAAWEFLLKPEVPKASAPPFPVAPMITKPEPPRELGFGELMAILGEETKKPAIAPVARDFAREFMAKPPLRKIFNDYKKAQSRGRQPSAAGFMERLRRTPEFRAVSSRFASGGGMGGGGGGGAGSSAMMRLSENPKLRDFMLDQKQAVAREGKPPAERKKKPVLASSKVAPSAGSADGDRAAFSGSAVPSSAGAVDTGGATQSGSVPSVGGTSDASTSGSSSSGDKKEGDKKSVPPPVPLKLPSITEVKLKEFSQRFPWMDVLSESERLAVIEDSDLYGLWGACVAHKIYSKCARACNLAASQCTLTPAWTACLEYDESENKCATWCKGQTGCQVPSDVIARLCPDDADPWPAYCGPKPKTVVTGTGTGTGTNISVGQPGAVGVAGSTPTAVGHDPQVPGGKHPCEQTTDPFQAIDCDIFYDQPVETQENFRAHWGKDGPGRLSESGVARRWVTERNKDILQPGWRELPESQGGYR